MLPPYIICALALLPSSFPVESALCHRCGQNGYVYGKTTSFCTSVWSLRKRWCGALFLVLSKSLIHKVEQGGWATDHDVMQYACILWCVFGYGVKCCILRETEPFFLHCVLNEGSVCSCKFSTLSSSTRVSHYTYMGIVYESDYGIANPVHHVLAAQCVDYIM
jgi:hypothetical protein